MNDDIDKIMKNSNKADLIERLSEELEKGDPKVIVILLEDMDNYKYTNLTMTLGLEHNYDVYAMLEIAKQDFKEDGY